MNRLRLIGTLVVFWGAVSAGHRFVQAQRSFDGPPIDRILGFLDRNRSGEIDPEEFDRMPGRIRDAMSRLGIDGSRPVGIEELERLGPRLQEALRFRRDDDDDGDDDGNDGDRRRFGDRERGDRRDSRDRGRSSRPSKPAPRPKVTFDLPESHRPRDKDGDGQIGLYEWDRAALPEFFKLDHNGDGFITPLELLFPVGTTAGSMAIAGGGGRPGGIPSASATGTAATTTSPAATTSASASSGGSEASADAARYERFAQFTFRSLDRDRDGKLTAEEWDRSRRTKDQFEEAKVTLSLPATYEQFKTAYVQVRTADR